MKKLLALVLALVMTLGLATVGANAATFSDADSITYKEAVDVMSAIGVLDGMDGAFNPTGTLTREQGAKIIAYMILGKTAADSLSTTSSPFTDVAADRWSAGAIAYCASENIIGGVGEGKFNPEGQLTGHAFAKMLLVALGYKPEIDGLVGNDWSINTSKLAFAAGLTKDLDDVLLSNPVTREQAAKLAFNTETATMVEYSNGVNVATADGTKVTVDANRSDVRNTTTTYYYNGIGVASENTTMQFCERYATNLKYDTAAASLVDDFGRPATTWKLKNSNISKAAKEPTLTYTKAVSGETIYKDLGKVAGTKAGLAFTAYLDGDAATGAATGVGTYYNTASSLPTAAQIAAGVTADVDGTGKGRTTEVYYDAAANTMCIVIVKDFLAQANSDYNASKDTLSVTVDFGGGNTATYSLKGEDFAISNYKEDDYLYVTAERTGAGATAYTIKSVAPATNIVSDATVTGYRANASVVANGTSYDFVGATDVKTTLGDTAALYAGGWTLRSGTYDLILNPAGYVLSADEHTAGTTVSDYLFLSAVVCDAMSVRGMAHFMDGTSQQINVSKYIDAAGNSLKVGTDASLATAGTAGTYSATAVSANLFYKYNVDKNGYYELTGITHSAATAAASVATAGNQYSAATVAWTEKSATPAAGISANSKTVLVADKTAYTGAANFPKMTTPTVYVLCNDTDTTAMAIYTTTKGTGTSTAKDYLFVFGPGTNAVKNEDADGTVFYTYKSMKDGEITPLNVTSAGSNKAAGLYKVDTYEDSYAVLGTAITGDVADEYYYTASVDGAAISAKNEVITDGSETHILNRDAKIYLIDATKTDANVETLSIGAASTLETGHNYTTYMICTSSTDNSISTVILVKTS